VRCGAAKRCDEGRWRQTDRRQANTACMARLLLRSSLATLLPNCQTPTRPHAHTPKRPLPRPPGAPEGAADGRLDPLDDRARRGDARWWRAAREWPPCWAGSCWLSWLINACANHCPSAAAPTPTTSAAPIAALLGISAGRLGKIGCTCVSGSRDSGAGDVRGCGAGVRPSVGRSVDSSVDNKDHGHDHGHGHGHDHDGAMPLQPLLRRC
jgi:hypothetical protein